MKSKKALTFRLPFWLVLVLVLGLFFVMLIIVLQQTSSTNLTARIPQTVTVTEWACGPIDCDCYRQLRGTATQRLPNPFVEIESVGIAFPGEYKVCTEVNLLLEENLLSTDEIDPRFVTDNCNTICQQEFPQPSEFIVTGKPSLNQLGSFTCRKNGQCTLLTSQTRSR